MYKSAVLSPLAVEHNSSHIVAYKLVHISYKFNMLRFVRNSTAMGTGGLTIFYDTCDTTPNGEGRIKYIPGMENVIDVRPNERKLDHI